MGGEPVQRELTGEVSITGQVSLWGVDLASKAYPWASGTTCWTGTPIDSPPSPPDETHDEVNAKTTVIEPALQNRRWDVFDHRVVDREHHRRSSAFWSRSKETC